MSESTKNLLETPTGWSVAEKEAWAGEVFDDKKVLLHCGLHSYVGSDTPPKPRGCKECWQAYWWFKIARTPPHLRAQRIEEAIKMVRDANQAIEQGTWDFHVDERYPHATIEKNGFDDVTRDYRKAPIKITDA